MSLDKGLPATIELTVRVVPGASKNEIIGEVNGVWKVRLTAPPVDGKANLALMELLADKLKVNRSQVMLCGSKTSRCKRVAIYGLSTADIANRLSAK